MNKKLNSKKLTSKKPKKNSLVKSHKATRNPVVVASKTVPSVYNKSSVLQNYIANLNKLPRLTKQEEYQLTVEYFKNKDPQIEKQLIQANLKFVIKIAIEYSRFSSKLMDLIQEGNIGLIKAIKEFNPYSGARLITYAVWWIRGYIQEYLMRHYSIVRIGKNKKQRQLFYLLTKNKQQLENFSEKYFLPNLAKESNNNIKDVETMKHIVLKKDFSLDQPISEDGTQTFASIQTDKSMSLNEELSLKQISQLLKTNLKKMEKDFSFKDNTIIQKRLLQDPPCTLQALADKFSVSKEAIRQNEERIMKKIKQKLIPILKKPY